MKRLLCLALALGCLFTLSGCRSREERQEIRRQLDYANGKTSYELEGEALDDGTTLEQQVFYAQHGITCTLLGIYEDSDSYYLPYSIRNESKGAVDLSLDALILNGWSGDAGNTWLSVIEGGMDYGVYQVYKDSLPEPSMLGPLATVQLSGIIYGEEDDFYEDLTATLSTSNPQAAAQQLPGEVIYQDDLVTITYLGLVETNWEYEFRFTVENTSSGRLYLDSYFYDEDVPCAKTVNGTDIGDLGYLYSAYLAPGTRDLLTLELYYDDLDGILGIQRAEEITSLTFPCRVEPDELRPYGIALELDLTGEA